LLSWLIPVLPPKRYTPTLSTEVFLNQDLCPSWSALQVTISKPLNESQHWLSGLCKMVRWLSSNSKPWCFQWYPGMICHCVAYCWRIALSVR
jgi:hypothetical protein